MRDCLARFGAALPRDPAEAQRQSSARPDPPNWWLAAKSLGWRADGKAFVLRDRTLGLNGSGRSMHEPRLVPSLSSRGKYDRAMSCCGTLRSWKRDVATMAKWSSPIALALSAAFAAPLLKIIDWPTFMLVLHGTGKAGKSTAALCGDLSLASVWKNIFRIGTRGSRVARSRCRIQ